MGIREWFTNSAGKNPFDSSALWELRDKLAQEYIDRLNSSGNLALSEIKDGLARRVEERASQDIDYMDHYEIIPEVMGDLRSRYCVEKADSKLTPDQVGDISKKLGGDQFKEAVNYIRENFGEVEFDFCRKGMNGQDTSYTIHNSLYGLLFTNGYDLAELIGYSFNTQSKRLYREMSSLYDRAFLEADIKGWSREQWEAFDGKRDACLAALWNGSRVEYFGGQPPLEWICLEGLKKLESVRRPEPGGPQVPNTQPASDGLGSPEVVGNGEIETEVMGTVEDNVDGSVAKKTSDIAAEEFQKRLGKNTSWGEWVALGREVGPRLLAGKRGIINDIIYGTVGAGSFLITASAVVIRIVKRISLISAFGIVFKTIYKEALFIKTVFRWAGKRLGDFGKKVKGMWDKRGASKKETVKKKPSKKDAAKRTEKKATGKRAAKKDAGKSNFSMIPEAHEIFSPEVLIPAGFFTAVGLKLYLARHGLTLSNVFGGLLSLGRAHPAAALIPNSDTILDMIDCNVVGNDSEKCKEMDKWHREQYIIKNTL